MQHSSDIRFYGEFSPYLQDSSNMLDIVIQGIARPSFKKLSPRPNRAYDTNSKLRTLQNVRCFHIIALSSVKRLFFCAFPSKIYFSVPQSCKGNKKGEIHQAYLPSCSSSNALTSIYLHDLEGYEHSGCANSSPTPLLLAREGGLSADDTHVLPPSLFKRGGWGGEFNRPYTGIFSVSLPSRVIYQERSRSSRERSYTAFQASTSCGS